MDFALDARLNNDTFPVGKGVGTLLLLMNDSRYPWFIVVPTRPNVCEWFDLPEAEQVQHHVACIKLGRCLQSAFSCDKINIAALGNIVRQMHIHVVGRNTADAAWPGPVWGHSTAVPYTETQLETRRNLLFAQQDLPFTPI